MFLEELANFTLTFLAISCLVFAVGIARNKLTVCTAHSIIDRGFIVLLFGITFLELLIHLCTIRF